MTDITKRRRAREIALQVLFQKEFVAEVEIAASLAYFRKQLEAPEESWTYAAQILHGIEEHRQEIDARLTDKSRNWKLSRMAPVDLSVLRIGVYELCHSDGDVPPKVAIDEAIEIVRKYGGTESAHFVNGLLDEVYRGLA